MTHRLNRWAIVLPAFLAMCAIPAVTSAQAPEAGAPLPNVLCASTAGERQTCAADTTKGVHLVKSTGPGACELGRTWGYDHAGVWVAEGCSGEFAPGTQAKVFGQYGDPWDLRFGASFYPWKNQAVRWNNELLYLRRSPVGGLSLPYVVGGNGPVFYSSFLLDL